MDPLVIRLTPELRRELVEALLAEEGWEIDYRGGQIERLYGTPDNAVIPIPSDEEWNTVTGEELEERWQIFSLLDYFGLPVTPTTESEEKDREA